MGHCPLSGWEHSGIIAIQAIHVRNSPIFVTRIIEGFFSTDRKVQLILIQSKCIKLNSLWRVLFPYLAESRYEQWTYNNLDFRTWLQSLVVKMRDIIELSLGVSLYFRTYRPRKGSSLLCPVSPSYHMLSPINLGSITKGHKCFMHNIPE